jgi:tetratricopeptide (TPR) repeat protein
MMPVADLFALAQRNHRSGELAGAEALYRQILGADPSHAGALHLLGLLSHQTGRHQDALGLIRQAIQIKPNVADFHFNLGIALVVSDDYAAAAECFRHALRLNPNDALGHYNLGNALYKQGKLEAATEYFREALRINPNQLAAQTDLGHALFWQGDLEAAVACYRQAVRIGPNHANAHVDLGSALLWQGQYVEAAEWIGRALQLDPGNKKGIWHRSWLRLQQGQFDEGWPDYEQRPALSGTSARTFNGPRWDGAPLQGKTILVHAEQGLGDTLQFARYLPMVKRQGGAVVFECQSSLASLLSGFPGVDQLIAAGAALPPFDVHIPLLSLPLLFGTTLATIPADVPYLQADAQRVFKWQDEIRRVTRRQPAGSDKTFKIGIAWQGSLDQQTQKGDRRCVALSQFAPLAHIEDVRLYSLQVGPGTRELAAAIFPIIDLGSRFNADSMEDLAAALMNLDLIVTIDSAVAHLAGTLGVPVWTLLSYAADWRWLLDRSDSPWYPTMHLYRQKRLGDWVEVMQQVAADCRSHALKNAPPIAGSALPE